MTIKIGINGLGRIGRCVLRAYFKYQNWNDIEIVAVNGRGKDEDMLHFLKYDSTHGIFAENLKMENGHLYIGDKKIRYFKHDDPANINWSDVGVDVVLECTGKFRSKADAGKHLGGSVKKVLISAPSSDADSMIVYGVNNEILKESDEIISVGSCTTNCLAPVLKVINDEIGIENGFMTTIHSYTNDQNILDRGHKDLRRARAAAISMIPTSTGAARAIGVVLPELEGKLDGTAVRVPTHNVSMVDLVFNAKKTASVEVLNNVIKNAAETSMKGVLDYINAPLVSVDFNGNPNSSIFDSLETYQVGEKLFRVATWYDNEWGFSCRMLDVCTLL